MTDAYYYKEAQKKRLAAFKVNTVDLNGYLITKIFGRGDEFVIYEIETKDLVDSIKVYIDTVIENDKAGIIKNYNAIRIKVAEIKGLLYKVRDKATIRAVLSQIIIHALVDDPEKAAKELDDLKKDINDEYRELYNNRRRLLLFAFLPSVLLISCAIFEYMTQWHYDHIHFKNIIYVCAAGSIGGVFSVALGINKIECDRDVKWWLYGVYGLERALLAVLAAVIVYFAVQANIIAGDLGSMHSPVIGYILFSFVAGFSETFIPGMLTRFEEKKTVK